MARETPPMQLLLPTPPGWQHSTISVAEADNLFGGRPFDAMSTSVSVMPDLPGTTSLYINSNPYPSLNSEAPNIRMRGWQRPGPGPRRGLARIPRIDELKIPFSLGLIHLVKEALHFQQLYSFHSVSHYSSPFEFSRVMSSLAEFEHSLPVSKVMKRSIWTLTHQLGVPGFLLKLKSPYHAIAIYLMPDTGLSWSCSFCRFAEVNHRSCGHVELLNSCVSQVSRVLNCSAEYLISSMTQSAAFNHIPDLSVACFYGTRKRHEFSVLRNELRDRLAPITSAGRIQLVRRLAGNRGWRCLSRSCAGVSQTCLHLRSVEAHIQRGLTHCFSNIQDLLETLKDSTGNEYEEELDAEMNLAYSCPRYSRPLVPSEVSFRVDFDVTKNAHDGTTLLLRAAGNCHCGISREAAGVSPISLYPLRVETTRCFVEYRQEVWKCQNGHTVTPEHDVTTREGLVWLSRDTAFTEVFLFDLLLHMTVGGATLSSQTDLRAQILSLQTEYMNRGRAPRSPLSVRKALTAYAMAVVQDIPPWVFRCSKCAEISNGEIYYDKMSFDGQQVGFNIRKDVRYDFYGKPSTPWRRPVKRDAKAANITLLIQSRSMRMIVLDALRVRDVPRGSTSVHAICRAMMSMSLRTKDAIRSAVAAIKLFDPQWTTFLPTGTPTVSENSYDEYIHSANPEHSAHPIHFIVKEKNPTATDFSRAKIVLDIFRHVLDCTKAAQAISVLVNELRGDLKTYIPMNDREFLRVYAQHGNTSLHSWICELAHLNSWSLIMPNMTNQQVQDILAPGIAEHVESLVHPVRIPFSWQECVGSQVGSNIVNMFSRVRKVGRWISPRDAQTSILMLFMALLNEPVNVWLRDSQFVAIEAGIEVLRNAYLFCGEQNVIERYRRALEQAHSIGLLYEGLLGIIGANNADASHMYTTTLKLLELVPILQDEYERAIQESATTKQFMCTPKEFDDMLYCTQAFSREDHVGNGIRPVEQDLQANGNHMRNLYDKLAKGRSNDFLETGMWAPDFPLRRPSPSSSMWATDTAHTEASCSKNFNAHAAFSPGTFGAYCLCKHAKTLMVTFLKRPEGCRMPLNAIVERCSRLPRYVIYDFACGTQKAAACLSSAVTRRTRFVVDPFHFPGHKTCSLAMHEASYEDLRGCNMESQEQRNSNIKNMERTLRASKDVHFIHFVILAHAYLNMKAMFLDYKEDTANEDDDGLGPESWLRWIRNTYQQRNQER